MIKDRGNIKWTAMMLPEHVEMIKEVWRAEKKQQKPILDEQQMQEMNDIICEAAEHNDLLHFTYFKNGEFHLLIGYIHHIDSFNLKLRIKDKFDDVFIINMNDLIHVNRH